ncbi:hypothetical protein D3C78_1858780 [compost metagenome]
MMTNGSRRLSWLKVNQAIMLSFMAVNSWPPVAMSRARPAMVTAKVFSSRERGTLPSSRACSSFRAEGDSVRSSLSESSAIARV